MFMTANRNVFDRALQRANLVAIGVRDDGGERQRGVVSTAITLGCGKSLTLASLRTTNMRHELAAVKRPSLSSGCRGAWCPRGSRRPAQARDRPPSLAVRYHEREETPCSADGTDRTLVPSRAATRLDDDDLQDSTATSVRRRRPRESVLFGLV
jgi:hypothetical protein